MTLRNLLTAPAVFFAICFSGACGDSAAPIFTAPAAIAANPNPAVPLAAIVSAQTDEPAVLLIQVRDGDRQWSIPEPMELTTQHSLPVLGFRPGRKHVVEVSARDEAGNVSAAASLEFETAPLPGDFPLLTVTTSTPEKMEPGVTLFSFMRWPEGAPLDEHFGLAVAVDEHGDVVWYRRSGYGIQDPHRMANGNMLSLLGHHGAEEVDMLGNVVASWHASQHPNPKALAEVPKGSIPVETETFHHDIQEMPSGNLLVLSTEMRRIENYPTVPGDDRAPKAAANVIGDIVVEFARDGSIVNQWKLMDLLDVQRLGYESLGAAWNLWAYVDVEGGTKDWAHANSVAYDAASDSILVSARHQEAVISFSRASGELNWIMGPHEGWPERLQPYLLKPEGEFTWQYHQHAAEMTPNGTLILFDNGNFRAMPPAPKMSLADSFSRAAEFTIDMQSKTIRQVWSYGGPGQEMFYSPFISEADRLPQTGNVLITDGGRIRDKQGNKSDSIPTGHHWARIIEVTHGEHPEKAFEIIVDSQPPEPSVGWAVYRSERLPSLYGN